jgi:hypothetical protein
MGSVDAHDIDPGRDQLAKAVRIGHRGSERGNDFDAAFVGQGDPQGMPSPSAHAALRVTPFLDVG